MLTSLRCIHWRNLSQDPLPLASKTVFLVGENGQGKSNLLEAIYYLIYQSSWRPFELKSLMTQGSTGGFSLEGHFSSREGAPFTLGVKQQDGEKTLSCDGLPLRDRREFLKRQAPLIFSPSDLAILQGSPARRRDFLDQTLTLLDDGYLTTWRRYARVLAQRNALLRKGGAEELESFDKLFSSLSLEIIKARLALVADLSHELPTYARTLLGNWQEDLTIEYESPWLAFSSAEEIEAFLLKRRESERSQGFSLYGPHRDRFVLRKEGMDVSLFASHGQLRALVLILRLLQAKKLSENKGRLPTLLLDDILLEMDGGKREIFFSLLPEYAQAFFTFLPDEPFSSYARGDTLLYRVQGGTFRGNTL